MSLADRISHYHGDKVRLSVVGSLDCITGKLVEMDYDYIVLRDDLSAFTKSSVVTRDGKERFERIIPIAQITCIEREDAATSNASAFGSMNQLAGNVIK